MDAFSALQGAFPHPGTFRPKRKPEQKIEELQPLLGCSWRLKNSCSLQVETKTIKCDFPYKSQMQPHFIH